MFLMIANIGFDIICYPLKAGGWGKGVPDPSRQLHGKHHHGRDIQNQWVQYNIKYYPL